MGETMPGNPNEFRPHETVQRLMDIDVREVSLVDRPANEEVFLVVKRNDDGGKGNMSDKSNPETCPPSEAKPEPPPAAPEVPAEPVEKAKPKEGEPMEAAKAEGDIVKIVTDAQSALKSALASAKKQEGYGASDPKKLGQMLMSIAEMCEEAAMACGAGSPEMKNKPARKSLTLAFNDDGTVEVSGEPVEKAKQLTAARADVIKDALTKLLTLAKEISPDLVPAILKELGEDAEKACAAHGGGRGGKKVEMAGAGAAGGGGAGGDGYPTPEDYGKKTKALEEQVATLTKRLEDMEKARGTSNAAPTDTTAQPVQKDKGGFWDNIL